MRSRSWEPADAVFFAEMNDNENVMRCFPVPLSVKEANKCSNKLTFGPEIYLDFSHGFLGAFPDAFATLDAESVVYDRVSLWVLRDGSYRTCLYEGTDVIVRADGFVDLYHGSVFSANLVQYACSAK